MTQEPRTKEQVYNSLRNSLSGKIAKLRNFTERSFNFIWTQAFAEEIQELEAKALVAELAGWIDYTGKELNEDDIEDLGLEGQVTAEQLNKFMKDEYLDEYVKIVGLTRFDGTAATGTVTIQTQSEDTLIPEGTIVATPPNADGVSFQFKTTENAETSNGVSSVSNVPIEAVEVGTEYNVPANEITQFDNPPIGVRGVTNPASTTGGEDEESNEELRTRAKNAVRTSSLGGTTDGIKGYIQQNIDGVGEGDVIIDQFTDSQPPFVDVIVDGGLDEDVIDAIDFSRPTGIEHNLIRPQIIQLGWQVDALGSDIGTTTVEEDMEEYLLTLGIGENFYEDDFIREIMESDDDIINIDDLGGFVERVSSERFEFNQDIDSAIADDGGSLTVQTSDANDDGLDDITLLPESPAVGDAYYFGMDSPFSGFDIQISTAGSGTWDIVWEYFDGSTWQTLPNISDGTSDFQSANENTVSWDVPSDWVRRRVDEDRKYFVRARLNSYNTPVGDYEQPLGAQVRVTGSSYKLDFTYEDGSGSFTLEDSDGTIYTKGTDFTLVDKTGDGWPETIQWTSNQARPDHEQFFFVDYDVTTDATTNGGVYHTNLVRDKTFIFDLNREETYTYDKDNKQQKLAFVPFDDSTSIIDENDNTYVEGTDYEIISVGEGNRDESFTYNSSKNTYYLRSGADEKTVEIIDEDEATYVRGTDFTVIDTDSSGVENAIQWDTNESTPNNEQTFTVSYKPDNNIPQTIDWSFGGGNPDDNDDYTITYDKKVYHPEYEIVETPGGVIDDETGETYQQNEAYQVVDYSTDGENDAIEWLQDPATLGTLTDGKEFYFEYFTEGDLNIENRKKIDPGTISVTQV